MLLLDKFSVLNKESSCKNALASDVFGEHVLCSFETFATWTLKKQCELVINICILNKTPNTYDSLTKDSNTIPTIHMKQQHSLIYLVTQVEPFPTSLFSSVLRLAIH